MRVQVGGGRREEPAGSCILPTTQGWPQSLQTWVQIPTLPSSAIWGMSPSGKTPLVKPSFPDLYNGNDSSCFAGWSQLKNLLLIMVWHTVGVAVINVLSH